MRPVGPPGSRPGEDVQPPSVRGASAESGLPATGDTSPPLRICSYEDRPVAMGSVILMAESLCRVDGRVSLHLTVPNAPAAVRGLAERIPQVVLSTTRPEGVTGWDVKPWLLLQELDGGRPEALWLDTDIIVTRPVSALVKEFPRDRLIVAEEWNRPKAERVTDFWKVPAARPVAPVNSCFVRVTPAHRTLLERWLQMTHDPRYRAAQALPFAQRPFHLASDQVLLTALLGTEDFGQVPFDYIRMGRQIIQCAGSSGYRPGHRLLDLFRGLPPLIHCVGRKPWEARHDGSRMQRFLLDFAMDVSPYVLSAQKVARDLGMKQEWLETRTWPGNVLRKLTAGHPGVAGLPLAIPHAIHGSISRMIGKK